LLCVNAKKFFIGNEEQIKDKTIWYLPFS